MRCRLTAILFCVGALTACSDRSEQATKLSKEEAELLDAVMFALTGIEDNLTEKDKSEPWKRQVIGRTIEFAQIGKNGIGTSDAKRLMPRLGIAILFATSKG
jgi:hypothetical protein